MIRPPSGRFGETETDVTGQVVPCPDCGGPTGVPVPKGSTIVGDAEGAGHSTTTKCPSCDTRFEVGYGLESGD